MTDQSASTSPYPSSGTQHSALLPTADNDRCTSEFCSVAAEPHPRTTSCPSAQSDRSPAYRYLGVSMIVRVPADFDRDAMEDRIVQLVGCEGVNTGACSPPEGCPVESFGTCCTEDSESAFRWLLGPDPDEPTDPSGNAAGAAS